MTVLSGDQLQMSYAGKSPRKALYAPEDDRDAAMTSPAVVAVRNESGHE